MVKRDTQDRKNLFHIDIVFNREWVAVLKAFFSRCYGIPSMVLLTREPGDIELEFSLTRKTFVTEVKPGTPQMVSRSCIWEPTYVLMEFFLETFYRFRMLKIGMLMLNSKQRPGACLLPFPNYENFFF